jgi:UDP-N-acetylmuramate--alanine ligase
MLGKLMDLYDGIAISGTHGKSTSSGWLVYCLDRAGMEPNYLVGGDVPQLGGSSGVGDSKLFIAEACEYDRSFLNLKPRTAAILNIEQDHLDYYGDEGKIIEAFTDYANCVRSGGTLIANGEDANVAKVLEGVRGDIRCITFGLDSKCNFSAANLQLIEGLYHFDIYHNGLLLGPAKSALPGEHNVMNALAVTALAINAGLEPREIPHLLGGFSGVDRRLMLKGMFGGVTVLDDYAHHPTEIRASLSAIRQLYEPDRLWCVFQPHQYSRTRYLLDDFAGSFGLADMTIIPEIYFVRDHEESKQHVNSQILVERILRGRSNVC